METEEYISIPFGANITLSESESRYFVECLSEFPASLRDIMTSAHTGAFIRGLVRSYSLPKSTIPLLAATVFYVASGRIPLAKLGSFVSAKFKIPNDKAQGIAREIEKDIFTPVGKDFAKYLTTLKAKEAEKKATAGSPSKQAIQNIVNLKDKHQEIPPPKPNSSKPNEPIF